MRIFSYYRCWSYDETKGKHEEYNVSLPSILNARLLVNQVHRVKSANFTAQKLA